MVKIPVDILFYAHNLRYPRVTVLLDKDERTVLTIKGQYQSFILVLAGLCLFYLGFEIYYIHHVMLSVDEFWFAHVIYHYKDGLPYRDFSPYKTVLGYYLLLLSMLSTHGIVQTLLLIKNSLAVCNTLILFFSSLWLTRFFSRSGILAGLAILVSSEIVLSYSSQIRVDLIGYWFCFFSILLLLENRYLLAGLLIGLGFATTQKTIWYIFASNCALAAYWLVNKKQSDIIRKTVIYNLVCAMVILSYLAFWAWFSNWDTVIHNVFFEASAMYKLDWYDSARKLFWEAITLYNPLIFLLAPVTLISTFVTYDDDKDYQNRVFVLTYALVILICLIPYKQVFPYYMQVTIPVFFLLYTAFFSWLFAIFTPHQTLHIKINEYYLWALLVLYTMAITVFVVEFKLPFPYLLICLIPISLIAYITNYDSLQQQLSSLFFSITIITVIFMGLIYPFSLFPAKMTDMNGNYQKAHLQAINKLLEDGTDYVAGVELIYNKTQPIAGLRHLMGPAIDYLSNPSPKLRSVMLASLYEDPNATTDSVIAALQKSSVKFFVNNYRIMGLPAKLKNYFGSQYEHLWGSVYIYAPQISGGVQSVSLKFSGKYLVESTSIRNIGLNGKHYPKNAIIYLKKGSYQSSASGTYRLKLVPDNIAPLLDPHFQMDNWNKLIF